MLRRCHKPCIIDKVAKNMVFRIVVAVSFMISKMRRCAFNYSARCVSAFKRVFTTILKSLLVLLGVICYIPKHVVINAFFIISSVSINIFKQSEGLQDVSKCLILLCIALHKVRSELYALCSYEVVHRWFNARVQRTFHSLFYFLWPHDFAAGSGLSSNGSTATPIQPLQSPSAHMSAAELHKTDSTCTASKQTQDIAGFEHARRGAVDIEQIRSRAVTLRGSEEDLRQASERLRLKVHALQTRMATLGVNLNVKTKPNDDKSVECDNIESPVKLENNRDLSGAHSVSGTLQNNCDKRVSSHQLTSSKEDATSDCDVSFSCSCEATQYTPCSSRYSLSEPELEVEKTERVYVEENGVVVDFQRSWSTSE